ncbi:hypothetical protein GGX14DRAFT_403381 [Mycena pura]|uniref:Uncharacterized protein n=1 Tax=Mycena pura TaxID=153505 RepID=A0AAD6Y2T4_9AGAR|nr:hypothetical protein GGX14DRAFT_403381 [Mycena pura]
MAAGSNAGGSRHHCRSAAEIFVRLGSRRTSLDNDDVDDEDPPRRVARATRSRRAMGLLSTGHHLHWREMDVQCRCTAALKHGDAAARLHDMNGQQRLAQACDAQLEISRALPETLRQQSNLMVFTAFMTYYNLLLYMPNDAEASRQRQKSAMGLKDDAAVLPLMPSVPLELRESHFFRPKIGLGHQKWDWGVPVPLFSYILTHRLGKFLKWRSGIHSAMRTRHFSKDLDQN